MKKLLIGLAFSFICFSGFAVEDPWNACGLQDILDISTAMGQNLCEGTYYIKDICNNDNIIPVTVPVDGPNSSCANPE